MCLVRILIAEIEEKNVVKVREAECGADVGGGFESGFDGLGRGGGLDVEAGEKGGRKEEGWKGGVEGMEDGGGDGEVRE